MQQTHVAYAGTWWLTDSCFLMFQGTAEGIEAGYLENLDVRLCQVDRAAMTMEYARCKDSLRLEFETFFGSLPNQPSLQSPPHDVRRFLVHKDKGGKTQYHKTEYQFLGRQGVHPCGCPRRLTAGTVESLIGILKGIFAKLGHGDNWDALTNSGNPAFANSVATYLSVIKSKQSLAHVVPKQPKPLFLDKPQAVCSYLQRESDCPCASLSDRFLHLRDKSLMSLQFFAGDRASDISRTLAQEVKKLPGDHGKTASSSNPKTFSVYCLAGNVACPVVALEAYVDGALRMALTSTMVSCSGRWVKKAMSVSLLSQ